jgi:imidazolonepropionase-like amidohydrolase
MSRLAVTAARLIDGTGRPSMTDPVVLLDQGRIVDVFRRGEHPVPPDVEVLDAPDGTIVPGLIDAHLHVAGLLVNADAPTTDPETVTDAFMRELTAAGITTVRDTGSPDYNRTFRQMKQGRPGWPRFFGSGPNLDGRPGGPWLGLRALDSPVAARTAVRELADGGVDFLKVYVWMDGRMMSETIDEARSAGLKVAAHVGNRVTVAEAVDAGVQALEHVRIGRELVPPDRLDALDALPPRQLDPLISFRPWRYADPEGPLADELIRRLLDAGVYWTPTLSLSASILDREGDAARRQLAEGSDLTEIVASWKERDYTADFSDDDWAWAPVELRRQMTFLGRAHEAGVPIVAGTDTPNPWILPGIGLHQELALLAACGLTPTEAIRCATSRAAELLDQATDFGTVASGKRADLVVVDGDPSVSIADLQRIRTVIRNGEPRTAPGSRSRAD